MPKRVQQYILLEDRFISLIEAGHVLSEELVALGGEVVRHHVAGSLAVAGSDKQKARTSKGREGTRDRERERLREREWAKPSVHDKEGGRGEEVREGGAHGDEAHAVEVLDETSGLAIVHPGPPSVDDREAEAVDPPLGTDGGHGGIDVTREDEEVPVGVADEALPQRNDRLDVLVEVDDASLVLPVGGVHVDGLLDVGLVEVRLHVVVNARVEGHSRGSEAEAWSVQGIPHATTTHNI